MAEQRYGYKMSIPEERYGKAGYCYFIADRMTDQVISCWAIGSKVHVEKLVIDSVENMNSLHQHRSQKLKGLERA